MALYKTDAEGKLIKIAGNSKILNLPILVVENASSGSELKGRFTSHNMKVGDYFYILDIDRQVIGSDGQGTYLLPKYGRITEAGEGYYRYDIVSASEVSSDVSDLSDLQSIALSEYFDTTGISTTGSMTQKAITNALNGKNAQTTFSSVATDNQAGTGWSRYVIGNIGGKSLVFHKQNRSTNYGTFNGSAFSTILLAWIEQGSTSDSQSQRTTLSSISNSGWSTRGGSGYPHWICVIGLI